jgi:hypothetical protein
MTYLVSSAAPDGVRSEASFADIEDALRAAKMVNPGLARINDLVSREWWIFQNGMELRGEEAAAAFEDFERAQRAINSRRRRGGPALRGDTDRPTITPS